MPDLHAVAPACWPKHPHVFDLHPTRQVAEARCHACFTYGSMDRGRRSCKYRIPKRKRNPVTVALEVIEAR